MNWCRQPHYIYYIEDRKLTAFVSQVLLEGLTESFNDGRAQFDSSHSIRAAPACRLRHGIVP